MATSAALSSEEWLIPAEDIPVRQGDIVISRDAASKKLLAIFVILTADCDFARNKFGTAVAALRVISFHQYLITIWSERQVAKVLADEQTRIVAQFGKVARDFGQSPPGPDAVVGWVEREAPETIASQFKLDEKAARRLVQGIERFRMVRAAAVPKDDEPPFSTLCRVCASRGDGDEQSLKTRIWERARNETHPDDLFYLNSLPQIDGSGFVVLLRDVIAITVERIVVSAERAVDSRFFLRVGRLQPTFKYAMSQGFGSLYSRIGLPNSYDLARKEYCSTVSLDLE